VSTTLRTALAAGALFLGGLFGGVLGSALFRAPAAPASGASPGDGAPRSDEGLRAAIEALTVEVRRANVVAPVDDDLRAPVDGEGTVPAGEQDFGAVVAALDRLTQALGQARGGVAGGGIGISPLVVPGPGSRGDALARLVGRSAEELAVEHRFLTYQQVLDRFGRPDEVSNGSWLYRTGSGDQREVFTFQFVDGYLMNIWP
jgi:hypothetical protein